VDTFVAVVFDDEAHAFKGAEALQNLHQNGDVIVYSAAVIAKDSGGKVSVKKAADEGPIGTAFGMLTGALVGVLAGPLAVAGGAVAAGSAAAAATAATGMAAGSMMGGTFGMFRDLYEAGISADVLDKLNSELAPGKSAVVASIDEIWTTPLDVKMKEVGGTVHRKLRIDIIDEQIERDIAASEAEMQALRDELKAADDQAKAWVQEKVDSAERHMKELHQKASDRLTELDTEFNARAAAIDAQISKAVDDAKTKLEKRKEELVAGYNVRRDKLQRAAKLAGEALS
jgi:uncharacterized membrane protein